MRLPSDASFAENPLETESPEVWNRLVEALAPASMMVCIQDRMGPALTAVTTPEDIWQDTLLQVWRDRSSCEWRGLVPFRRWVLVVAENRIRNAVDAHNTLKRGGGRSAASLDEGEGSIPPPVISTTPSRVASYVEQARIMRAALEELPAEQRDVVRLRLFEELSVDEVARQLALGPAAVKHRYRKGAERYHSRLQSILASRSGDR